MTVPCRRTVKNSTQRLLWRILVHRLLTAMFLSSCLVHLKTDYWQLYSILLFLLLVGVDWIPLHVRCIRSPSAIFQQNGRKLCERYTLHGICYSSWYDCREKTCTVCICYFNKLRFDVKILVKSKKSALLCLHCLVCRRRRRLTKMVIKISYLFP